MVIPGYKELILGSLLQGWVSACMHACVHRWGKMGVSVFFLELHLPFSSPSQVIILQLFPCYLRLITTQRRRWRIFAIASEQLCS